MKKRSSALNKRKTKKFSVSSFFFAIILFFICVFLVLSFNDRFNLFSRANTPFISKEFRTPETARREEAHMFVGQLESIQNQLKVAGNQDAGLPLGHTRLTKEQIKQLVIDRKELLFKIMDIDPDTAYRIVHDQKVNRKITAIAGSEYMEKEITVEGILGYFHTDGEDGTSTTAKILHDDNGNTRILNPANGHMPFEIGERLSIKGYALDNHVLFDVNSTAVKRLQSHSIIKKVSASFPDNALGEQKLSVFMLGFQNKAYTTSKSTIDDIFFNKANAYYRTNSYGKMTFVGSSYGPYTLPFETTCDVNKILDAITQIAKNDVDFTQEKHVVIHTSYSCGPSSVGTYVAKDGSYTFNNIVMNTLSQGTVNHELGHSLGVHHASTITCSTGSFCSTSTASISEYGDPYDVMGQSGSGQQFNVPHKERLGWLTSEQVPTITKDGTYTIELLELNTNAVKGIKIRRGTFSPGLFDSLYLEFRQSIANGALIHTISIPLFTKTLLHKPVPLPLNTPLTDPATGVTVTVSSLSSSTIAVTVAGLGDGTNIDIEEPTVNITSPVQNQTVSGTISLSASASDNKGVTKVEFYRRGTNNPIAVSTTFPFQASFHSALLINGMNTLYAKAYDAANNVGFSGDIAISVSNTDTSIPKVTIEAPVSGATVSDPVSLRINASDDTALSSLAMYKDNESLPFYYSNLLTGSVGMKNLTSLLSKTFGSGTHTLKAVVYDTVLNTAQTEIQFTVSGSAATVTPAPTKTPTPKPTATPAPELTGTPVASPTQGVIDTTNPNVTITNPVNGAILQRRSSVLISATATDNIAVNRVVFTVSDGSTYTDYSAPYSYNWTVQGKPNTSYTIRAVAYDTSENLQSAQISVKTGK